MPYRLVALPAHAELKRMKSNLRLTVGLDRLGSGLLGTPGSALGLSIHLGCRGRFLSGC